jgi:hypothetical protein
MALVYVHHTFPQTYCCSSGCFDSEKLNCICVAMCQYIMTLYPCGHGYSRNPEPTRIYCDYSTPNSATLNPYMQRHPYVNLQHIVHRRNYPTLCPNICAPEKLHRNRPDMEEDRAKESRKANKAHIGEMWLKLMKCRGKLWKLVNSAGHNARYSS